MIWKRKRKRKKGTAQIEDYILVVSGDNGTSKTVEKDNTATFNIINNYTKDVGSLKIVKTTSGETTPENTEFVITGPNEYTKTVKYSEFTGGSYIINNLPVGTYKVEEKVNTAQITNYTLQVTGDNGTTKNKRQ